MPLLADYKALTSQSSSTQVQAALNAIIKANVALMPSGERVGLVEQILEDIKHKDKGRLHTSKDRPIALEALKALGRFPDAARLISSKPSLELLVKNSDISLDVSRTIANALLLQAEGRQNFIDVDGGTFALKMLSSNSDATSLFLASRLLFLMTHDASSVPFMRQMIDNGNILEITSSKLEVLVKQLGSDPMAKEGLSDMMKYIYNITLHFSRAEAGNDNLMMGEAWSDKLSSWVAPLISCFHAVPFSLLPSRPLQPPMTHIVHCLLSIPTENHKDAWYSNPTCSPIASSSANFFKAARSLFTSSLSTSRSTSPTPPNLRHIDSKSKKSKSRNSSPAPSRSSSSSPPGTGRNSTDSGHVDTTQRSFNLVSACLEHYFPGDIEVDAKEVRERATTESVNLDELIAGPMLLLRKLADGDMDARKKVKNIILPDDLDRTDPLEGRSDTLGRLIRLLSSVYHPRLANCAGELIFTLCDSDSSTMSAQIGYGNAAGYLFNKGILSAPAQPSSKGKEPRRDSDSSDEDDSEGPGINPITGTTYRPRDRSAVDEMTEEEKEQEAEKLFVLFDRLEKTGVASNPIKEALHRGELEKYKD